MYPFSPKSTAKLIPGQYWAIPLPNSVYGCGVILAIKVNRDGKKDSRIFLAGLLDWSGVKLPTALDIHDRKVLERGFAHIKTITENGKNLLGQVDPWWDWPAAIKDRDDISTWGYGVISILAKKHHGQQTEQGEFNH